MNEFLYVIITNEYQVQQYPNIRFDQEQFSTLKNIKFVKISDLEYAVLIQGKEFFSEESTIESIKTFGKTVKDTTLQNFGGLNIRIRCEYPRPEKTKHLEALMEGIFGPPVYKKPEDPKFFEQNNSLDRFREDIIREMTDEFDDDFDLSEEDEEDEEVEENDENEVEDVGNGSIEDFLQSVGIKKPSKKKKQKKQKISKILRNAKKKKKTIKKMNLIIVKKKKDVKRDKEILRRVIKEFFPGEGKFMKKFRKVILKRWVKMYSISKSTLKKIKKQKKKANKMSDIPDRIIRTFANQTNDIWNNPNR